MNTNQEPSPALAVTPRSAYDDETRLSRIIEIPVLFDAAQQSVGINETFGREHIDCVLSTMDEEREKLRAAKRRNLLEQRADIDRQLLKLDMAQPNGAYQPRPSNTDNLST